MPTYDYTCRVCDHTSEVTRSFITEDPEPQHCGQDMKRIYAATPAIFKGTGWGKDGQ
jgi:putative FmdB family regulatory protein